MTKAAIQDISYYPGCTLKSSMRDNNRSLKAVMRHIGYNLIELEDWNCCGASAAHSIHLDLTIQLASRNLSQAPAGRPLMAPCPSCLVRLIEARDKIKKNAAALREYENNWGRPFDDKLEIVHLFDLLNAAQLRARADAIPQRLQGLKFVPYYGCLLTRPSRSFSQAHYHDRMEPLLEAFGAQRLPWSYASQCCGTFLSITRPDVVSPLVDKIVDGALRAGADVIVTVCELCQVNLEVRCTLEKKVPIVPIAQLLTLALTVGEPRQLEKMLSHLVVDPRPMLRAKGLFSKTHWR